ncbi:PAS domain-containing protein [Actimicrobium antarcticum]|uniref:histidine kinase n=1 Tax=Actimicrobium antarcticum TaxID=1051899 RepID=A0ABP7STB2_9BURK
MTLQTNSLSGLEQLLNQELTQLQSGSQSALALRCRRIALGIGLAVMLVGAGALASIVVPTLRLMNSIVALGMLLGGLSLTLQCLPLKRSWLRGLLAQIPATLMALLGVALIAQGLSLFGEAINAVLGQLSFAITGSDTSMTHPVVAFSTALGGCALMLQEFRTRNRHAPAEFLALSLISLNLVPLAGLAYQVGAMAKLGNPLAVPFLPAVVSLAIGAGVLLSQPSRSMMAIITDNVPGGQMLRRSLPLTLLVLVILHWLVNRGALLGFYEPTMVAPTLTLLSCGVILMIFWRTAATVNNEYRARLQSARELAEASSLLIAVSDNTDDPIFVKDRAGKMIFANPATLRWIGKSREETLAHSSRELIPDTAEADQIDIEDQRIMQTGVSETIEQTLHLPGGVRTYTSTKTPWFDSLGQLRGLVGISTDITTRKEMEQQLKQREAELEATVSLRTTALRKLADHLETVREEEKRTIARELHDDMGASLTSLNMHLDSIYKVLPNETAWTDKASRVKTLVAALVATTRRIQIGLRPIMLDLFGLKAGIIEQMDEFEQRTGITCKTSLPDEEVQLPHKLEITLYRMLQEALNNVAKHARASRVEVILDVDEDQAALVVRDDGIGIPPERLDNQTTYGIRGLSERASFLGGSASVFTNPAGGTTVKIELPTRL